MKKGFGCGMEVKLATSVDHHGMPVVCILVIHLLVSFFELYCLSDVSTICQLAKCGHAPTLICYVNVYSSRS